MLFRSNKVLFLQDAQQLFDDTLLPTVEELTVILQKKHRNEMVMGINGCLERLEQAENMDIGSLGKFQQNFLQAIYIMLFSKGIQAQEFLIDEKAVLLLADSFRSVASLKGWIVYLIDKAVEAMASMNEIKSAVERVKVFIAHHLSDDLNRDAMANLVFLSPDYLTRIFKKETGIALNQYIIQERIKAAKVLLTKTNLPIREIALNVGCTNISHFSKFFKKNSSLSPLEYRLNYSKGS